MRLQLKAILAIATLLLATILILSLGAVHLMGRSLREESSRRGAEFSEHLARLAEYPLFVRDVWGLEEIIAERAGTIDIAYICFEDEGGLVLAAWHAGVSFPRLAGGGSAREALDPLVGSGRRERRDPDLSCTAPAGGDPRKRMDIEEFVAAVKLRPGSAPAGTLGAEGRSFSRPVGRVRIGMDYRHVNQAMSRIKKAVAATALPIAVIGLGVTLVLVRRVVRPLQDLARGIGEVGQGRLDQEVPVRGRDEVAELALAFNRMLRDLKASREELERVHDNLEHMVRRRTRELEESNRELAAASRTKSEFLANMSDGLRTPLNTILGFLGLVIEGQCENRDEERERLHEARQGAQHLLSIINSILDLAKIEVGKMSVQPGEVRVPEVFHEADSLLRGQADLKGIDLSFETSSADMPSVFVDPGKLNQVLVNLVSNAFKFTDRGSVRVSTQVCEDRGYVLFEVRDTGAG
ncbi:MAG: histidine kinase dimerization/phospho-acceptor domain-containing protein, partial [Acidobacteriota bacterium]